MHNLTKPPIGLIPKYLHRERRILEILNVIDSYVWNENIIKEEWIEELKELLLERNKYYGQSN